MFYMCVCVCVCIYDSSRTDDGGDEDDKRMMKMIREWSKQWWLQLSSVELALIQTVYSEIYPAESCTDEHYNLISPYITTHIQRTALY